jgi:UDP-N-acetylglucosamine:LPS N-acetylglucosamine transferase
LTAGRRIVVVAASYGGGHDAIAEALADGLRTRERGAARVAVLDLLERCAPRTARLARVAYGAGEEFFPDGAGDLAAIARIAHDDPLVRELLSGGMTAACAALEALRPDAVVAVHPVAAGIAAELRTELGCPVAAVVPDPGPGRMWVHPRCDLWFVASDETRDALVMRSVAWGSVVVSGVPVGPAPDAASARRKLGLEDRFTAAVPDTGRGDVARLVRSLAAAGVQVATTLPAEPAAAGARRGARPVVTVPATVTLADLVAASDVVVCGPCAASQWVAPALATPLVVVEPVPALERAGVDLLVSAGAALVARDVDDAAARVAYLDRHAERLASMRDDAGRIGRPGAVRVVSERLHALLS